jgi:uncharacterized repeat protein (TIGR02543 family)
MGKNKLTKGICILLTVVLIFGMISTASPAAGVETGGETIRHAGIIGQSERFSGNEISGEIGLPDEEGGFILISDSWEPTVDPIIDEWKYDLLPMVVDDPEIDIGYSVQPEAHATGLVTITYRGNGNTGGTIPANQLVTTPGSVRLAGQGNLSRTGYVFAGWRHPGGVVHSAGAQITWTTAITGPMTLYAHWVPAIVTVICGLQWAHGRSCACNPRG